MNILYTSSDRFVPQIAAGICSLCENNGEAVDLTIYIFSYGITPSHKDLLTDLGIRYNRFVKIYEINRPRRDSQGPLYPANLNPLLMARLTLDKYLPDSVERVIYLHPDVIVRKSLASLWDTDLGASVIAGCLDPTVDQHKRASLDMEGIPYINDGVLLINLKQWRQTKTGERIIGYYISQNGRLFANEQDAVNGVLKGELCYLSPEFNYCNIYDLYPYELLCRLMAPMKYMNRRAYEQAVADPAVIHYWGIEKPWRQGNRHPYRQEYQDYLAMTPFAGMKKEKGWKLRLFVYYFFIALTKPFPIIRYKLVASILSGF
ncbi:MAG: glycosyltransferase family 8 protein [Clostridiaceae bacterium]|nr:glycosyltransferase family 8 protein [Clostridiaceae bacterium]